MNTKERTVENVLKNVHLQRISNKQLKRVCIDCERLFCPVETEQRAWDTRCEDCTSESYYQTMYQRVIMPREKVLREAIYALIFGVFLILVIPVSYAGEGIASWYSETDPGINRLTANGEVFDDQALTCASWEYPFNARIRVTARSTGKSIECRVNDRGPSKRLKERKIDLTKYAFSLIEDTKKGLTQVQYSRLS